MTAPGLLDGRPPLFAPMLEYYSARASEYERIYAKPERQADLRELERRIPQLVTGKRVLEIACGTGYWTQFLATTARHITATDLSPETLRLAAMKGLPSGAVDFQVADAFDLQRDLGDFDAAFLGFWWSHIPKQALDRFLQSLHQCLQPESVVVIVDNLYVEGSSTAISRRDENGNSYQRRQLDNGSVHEVLKNFPIESEVRASLAHVAHDVSYSALTHYWLAHYETGA